MSKCNLCYLILNIHRIDSYFLFVTMVLFRFLFSGFTHEPKMNVASKLQGHNASWSWQTRRWCCSPPSKPLKTCFVAASRGKAQRHPKPIAQSNADVALVPREREYKALPKNLTFLFTSEVDVTNSKNLCDVSVL